MPAGGCYVTDKRIKYDKDEGKRGSPLLSLRSIMKLAPEYLCGGLMDAETRERACGSIPMDIKLRCHSVLAGKRVSREGKEEDGAISECMTFQGIFSIRN